MQDAYTESGLCSNRNEMMFNLDVLYAVQPDAIVREFRSLGEWNTFAVQLDVANRARMSAIASFAALHGVHSLSEGYVAQPQVSKVDDLPRWEIVLNDLNGYERPILELLATTRFATRKGATAIYAGEAISPLAMNLRIRPA